VRTAVAHLSEMHVLVSITVTVAMWPAESRTHTLSFIPITIMVWLVLCVVCASVCLFFK